MRRSVISGPRQHAYVIVDEKGNRTIYSKRQHGGSVTLFKEMGHDIEWRPVAKRSHVIESPGPFHVASAVALCGRSVESTSPDDPVDETCMECFTKSQIEASWGGKKDKKFRRKADAVHS